MKNSLQDKDIGETEMKNFINLFKKVGGKEILKRYASAHVLLYAFFLTLWLGFDKKSLEILRNAVNKKILAKLRKKYKYVIKNYNDNCKISPLNSSISERKIWICWFQGIENAPELVKKCYESVKKYITDREIILISEDNFRDYISFPDFIQEKIDKGQISKTHISDLLRLELLYQYGGTWIDATVMLTGELSKYMLDSELFLYQCLKPGLDGHATRISNWFMTSEKSNVIIGLVRELLYKYWAKNNKLIDYFIFHDFFELAIERYPMEWKKVVPVSNSTPHILLLRLFDKYDEIIWNEIKSQTSVHKLTYKFAESQTELQKTYYSMILK